MLRWQREPEVSRSRYELPFPLTAGNPGFEPGRVVSETTMLPVTSAPKTSPVSPGANRFQALGEPLERTTGFEPATFTLAR